MHAASTVFSMKLLSDTHVPSQSTNLTNSVFTMANAAF